MIISVIESVVKPFFAQFLRSRDLILDNKGELSRCGPVGQSSCKIISIILFVRSDWNKYDFDALMKKTWRFEYTAMVELTTELMVVEFAHRLIVCLFEVNIR